MAIEIKQNYVYVRLRPPELFDKSTYVTTDVGRMGHSYLIRARNKKTGSMETQSLRVKIVDVISRDEGVMDMLDQYGVKYKVLEKVNTFIARKGR